MTDLSRRWAWLAVAAIGAALVALFVVLPAGSNEQSIVYNAVGIIVIVAAVAGLALHRPSGWLPWALMILGQAAFLVGDILWTLYAAAGEDPFPSLADASYLAGYPLLAIGLMVAIRRRITGGDRAGALDAAILATGVGVVWWAFVLGPLAAASDPEPVAFAISIAYPIGDLVLLGMALGLVMTPGARSPSFVLLVASLATVLVADLAFGFQTLEATYVDGGTLDVLWLLAYGLFGAAVLHPTMTAVFEPRPIPIALLGPARLALLAGAMLVGPILLWTGRSGEDAIVHVVAVGTAGLSVLVVARLAGVVRHLASDIERRKALEAQLAFQAYHDPLTGLANRRRFVLAVEEALAAGSGTAALFVDLDDFKDVNDLMGHDAGDALLVAVGHRISAATRPGDQACRFGGDEFAVLLPATDDVADAEAVAERLVAALAEPVEIEGRSLAISASVGVGMVPSGARIGVDELLRRADVAMYHAKARGKHRWATYTPSLEPESVDHTPRTRAPRPSPA